MWCPKCRRECSAAGSRSGGRSSSARWWRRKGAWLVVLDVMPDHVHLLVEVDPQFGVHKLVKAIKGRASRVLREEFGSLRSRLPTLWTDSYFVATAGGAPTGAVDRYV
ncbi:IS200/IS605 family transposase [Micromonospora sp. NPDC006431]|uniref:IS200/IS605 family transposase n=1 Tax=Micromonospora sp. NPDC006431 TaxID=3364235 RepID=UPI003692329A